MFPSYSIFWMFNVYLPQTIPMGLHSWTATKRIPMDVALKLVTSRCTPKIQTTPTAWLTVGLGKPQTQLEHVEYWVIDSQGSFRLTPEWGCVTKVIMSTGIFYLALLAEVAVFCSDLSSFRRNTLYLPERGLHLERRIRGNDGHRHM